MKSSKSQPRHWSAFPCHSLEEATIVGIIIYSSIALLQIYWNIYLDRCSRPMKHVFLNEILKVIRPITGGAHEVVCPVYVIIISFCERFLGPYPIPVVAMIAFRGSTQLLHSSVVQDHFVYSLSQPRARFDEHLDITTHHIPSAWFAALAADLFASNPSLLCVWSFSDDVMSAGFLRPLCRVSAVLSPVQ